MPAGSGGAVKKAVSAAAVKKDPVGLLLPESALLSKCNASKPDGASVLQPKARPTAVKDEPLSPGVKSELDTSPQKGAKVKPTRAKKPDGEKRVIVKKEYDKPGQTRETPPEVCAAQACLLLLRRVAATFCCITANACPSLSQELSISNMLNAFAAIAIAKARSKQHFLLLNNHGQLAQQHRLP